MTGDGLFDPLGVGRAGPGRRAWRPSAPVLVAAICVAAASGLVAIAWWRDDGNRGRPLAVVPIEHVTPPPKPPQPAPPQPAPPPSAAPEAAAMPGLPAPADQEVEIQNGVRIIRPRRDRGAVPSQVLPVPGGTSAPAR